MRMPSSTPLHLSWCRTSSCSMAPRKRSECILLGSSTVALAPVWLFCALRSYREFWFHWEWYSVRSGGVCSSDWSSIYLNFPRKPGRRDLMRKFYFRLFFFLQLYEMNLGTLLTIKSMRLQLLCVLRVSRVAACQITERPECYGEI